MKNRDLGLVLVGVAAFLLLTQKQKQYNHYQRFPTVPPQPPRNNAAAWQQWTQTIIGTYGMVSDLWAPGGPFYKVKEQDVVNAAQAMSWGAGLL